ncbi:peptidoglycan-binding protein [Streptomyces sp. IBSNAI002]|uniref:peptidoglycan-binding protein n=1 Tax=Streptomyces sp. IBSNAI002 TaxID=3457500 RepID=UPI003FD3AF1D
MSAQPDGSAAQSGTSMEDTIVDGEVIVLDVHAPEPGRRSTRTPRRFVPLAAGGALLLVAATAVALGWRSESSGSIGGRLGLGSAVVEEESAPGDAGASPGSTEGAAHRGAASSTAPPVRGPGATADPATAGTPGGTPAGADPSGPPATSVPGKPSATGGAGSKPPTSPAGPPTLSLGDEGEEVAAMQRLLNRTGFYDSHRYSLYDEDTKVAVRRFQEWSAVRDEVAGEPRGVYGPKTRKALERVAAG